jgi:hypothetical protein
MVNGIEYLLLGLAAIAAGFVNALAGGGTLITFPTLTFVGVDAVTANITNTVALLPGYLGGTFAQKKDLAGQRKRLWMYIPAGFIGGLIGGYLLLNTGEKLFTQLVPFLILLACGLLAVQDRLRLWLVARAARRQAASETGNFQNETGHRNSDGRNLMSETWAILPVGLASVYGGYFGAGLSVIILAVLGLVLNDSLTRLNALKQVISFSANLAAALFFVLSGKILWPVALVMAVGALLGGALGGRLAGRIQPRTLRTIVIIIGVVVAMIYLVK